MILETEPDQISSLDSLQLVSLMRRLLLAECRLIDIPLRAAMVPLQITVADGGEDGRVEWTGGADATNWFPSRLCIFQSKAQNLTEASLAAEVLKKPKKGPTILNAAISEAISEQGAYIVFCSHPCTGQKRNKLRKRLHQAIREAGEDPDRAAATEIYDSNMIANWVQTHPSVALWLSELRRGRSVTGFMSHDAWARAADVSGVPWVTDDVPRYVPLNLVVPMADRKDCMRNAWTFDQAAQAALRQLVEDKVAVRVTGPSGFGKSRFAFEMFNRRTSICDEIDGTTILYADLGIVEDEAAKLALEIADAGSPTLLVVDECPDDVHAKLVDIARRVGSRLRLVTIDVETKVVQAPETLTLRLEPAADEMISAIARAVAPALNQADAGFITDLARGFPKIAVLAAQQTDTGGLPIRSAEQVLDRIIWGHRQPTHEARRAIETLSLFEWVGIAGPVENEGVAVATLARLTQDAFVENIRSFVSRGFIVQRGHYVQVALIPLAASLGIHRLSLLTDNKLLSFFEAAPQRLKQSLLRRLRWLDISPEAKTFARTILSPNRLGNIAALNTGFGAECLDRLVHVDPDLAMATVHRVFGGLTHQELHFVEEGRRQLVWVLEKLAFRKESFDAAATLLRRLAAAETEKHISNNAAGQFRRLYQLYLSGTEAPPVPRLLVLDDGLQSTNLKEREVCVEALDTMLTTGHFSRSGGAEDIGSGKPLRDWMPKTVGETQAFFRDALKRLTDIATSDDPLAGRAKGILGFHIRDMLGSVDILPQQDASGDEMDEGEIAARQFLEAGEDAAVMLHEAEQVLDLVPLPVEMPVGRALVAAGGFGRDHRQSSARRHGLQDGVGVIGLVGDHRCGRETVEQGQGLRGVALLPGGQAEGQRVAQAVGETMQLAREAAARAAKRLLTLDFFAPAAQAWARTTVLSSIAHSRSASAAS